LAMPIGEARDALWNALREGFIPASGIEIETRRRVQIPALDWHELVPVAGKGETDEVRRGAMGTGYTGVLVPSIVVHSFWLRTTHPAASLPPTMRPDGDGFMPLYCAAQWIATEGGVLDFPPNELPRWRNAYEMLLAAITSERVRVIGLRAGEREPIRGHVF